MKANSIINVPSNAADNSLPPPSMTAADSIGPAERTRVAWVARAPQILTKINAEPLSSMCRPTQLTTHCGGGQHRAGGTNYSHLSNKRDVTLTDFGKFHHAQNKNPPCKFIDFITKLSIFLQNPMKIFLMAILSYTSLF